MFSSTACNECILKWSLRKFSSFFCSFLLGQQKSVLLITVQFGNLQDWIHVYLFIKFVHIEVQYVFIFYLSLVHSGMGSKKYLFFFIWVRWFGPFNIEQSENLENIGVHVFFTYNLWILMRFRWISAFFLAGQSRHSLNLFNCFYWYNAELLC